MSKIYWLSEYNWESGTFLKENAKSYKIRMDYPSSNGGTHSVERLVPKHKCAVSDERVCIVWNTDVGKNGRGSYYVERELYPEYRVEARLVARQHMGEGRVTNRDGIIYDER